MNKAEINKLAQLARIEVKSDEIPSLAADIESILGYVNQVQEVGGGDEKVESHRKNVLRADADPHPSGEYSKRLLAEASQRENGYIKVKQILPDG